MKTGSFAAETHRCSVVHVVLMDENKDTSHQSNVEVTSPQNGIFFDMVQDRGGRGEKERAVSIGKLQCGV